MTFSFSKYVFYVTQLLPWKHVTMVSIIYEKRLSMALVNGLFLNLFSVVAHSISHGTPNPYFCEVVCVFVCILFCWLLCAY